MHEGIDSVKDRIAFFQLEVEGNQIWEGHQTKNDIVNLAKSLNFTEIARGEGDIQYDMIFFNENKVGDFDLQKNFKRTVFLSRFRRIFASLRNLQRKYLLKARKVISYIYFLVVLLTWLQATSSGVETT